MAHWLALRQRLLRSLGCFLLLFVLCFYFSDVLLHQSLSPLLQILPHSNALVLTRVGSSFFLPIELAAAFALLLTLPYGLIELWRFALPGLYTTERRAGNWFLVSSLLLFLLGAAFCFWVILPWMFQFLVHYTPVDLRLMLDAADVLHLMLRMLMIFGLCFQLPLLLVLVPRMQWVSWMQLQAGRRFVIVGAFIVGMLLAPPDVWSQTLIAVPLYCLYEIGLFAIWALSDTKELAFFKQAK